MDVIEPFRKFKITIFYSCIDIFSVLVATAVPRGYVFFKVIIFYDIVTYSLLRSINILVIPWMYRNCSYDEKQHNSNSCCP